MRSERPLTAEPKHVEFDNTPESPDGVIAAPLVRRLPISRLRLPGESTPIGQVRQRERYYRYSPALPIWPRPLCRCRSPSADRGRPPALDLPAADPVDGAHGQGARPLRPRRARRTQVDDRRASPPGQPGDGVHAARLGHAPSDGGRPGRRGSVGLAVGRARPEHQRRPHPRPSLRQRHLTRRALPGAGRCPRRDPCRRADRPATAPSAWSAGSPSSARSTTGRSSAS